MKKLLLLLAFVLTGLTNAQEVVSLQIAQDARLGLFGDGKTYDAGTLDVTVSLVMQGDQQKKGYMVLYPEFEYADLEIETYKRWTVNIGYIFNELIINNLEIGASASYGFIDRGLTDFCWGGNAFVNYKLTDRFKIICNLQLTQRPDLEVLYGIHDQWRTSGFIGISYNLFDRFKYYR